MGVDYNSVGGVGIEISEQMVKTMIDNGVLTEDEWDDDPWDCSEKIGLKYESAGVFNYENHYFFIDGCTLAEINSNVGKFKNKLYEIGLKIEDEDIKIISDIYVS